MLKQQLLQRFFKGKILIIAGARQTGKTTLVNEIQKGLKKEETIFFNCVFFKVKIYGGLYQEVSKEVKNGLPFSSRIPFFFQRKKAAREKTELVIFVSHVIM